MTKQIVCSPRTCGADSGAADLAAAAQKKHPRAFPQRVSRRDDVVDDQNVLVSEKRAVGRTEHPSDVLSSVLCFCFMLRPVALEFLQRFDVGELHDGGAFPRQQLRLVVTADPYILDVHGHTGDQVKAHVLGDFEDRVNGLNSQRPCVVRAVTEFQPAHRASVASSVGERRGTGETAHNGSCDAVIGKLLRAAAAGNFIFLDHPVAVGTPHGIERKGGGVLDFIQKLHGYLSVLFDDLTVSIVPHPAEKTQYPR